MTHTEIYRRARSGDYKQLSGLNEFELTRFITYLLQKIREMEVKNAEAQPNNNDHQRAD